MARIRQVVAALAIAAVASHSLAGADAAPTSPKSQRPALSVAADGNFHDASGRAVILRGVNVATKVPDFAFLNATAPDAYKKFVDPLVDWGFNAVRLAFTLEAYYPTRGSPNAAYLASYRRMIQELGNRGIYTIVDFHQDAFSRWSLTGCGEGYPEWFVPDAVKSAPADQTSVPDLYAHACPFWGPRIGIFSDDEIKATYGQLYTPGNDIRNAFIGIIQEVAGSLRDLPSVIAYDLANELPKVTNTTVDHIPLYRDLTTAIRAVNPNAVIMYEETISGPGTKEELPNPEIANSIYSSHFYDTRVNLDFWMTQFDFWLAPGSAFLAQIDAGISAGQLLPLSVDAVSAAIQALGAVVGAIQAGEGILQQYYAGVKSFLPEQVQAAVESTVPQLQAQIAATAGALAALDFSTAWSADATTALIAQVEALRSVAYPYIFDLMAPALQPILPVLDSGATDYVKSIKQTATSYGSGYVLGEFGLPPTTIFVNPTQYIDEILNGVDSSLSSSVQWMYNPLWSPVTKDGWNMEDFSIIDNTGAPRANFHIYRPYPQVTAGTPVALSVNYAQKTMTYTFNATESDNPSVFYYHINGLCGAKGKAKVTSIPSGAVKCDTSNRNGVVTCENKKCGQVTVNLSCK